VRGSARRGILASVDTMGRQVAVEILLRVTRGAGDRLDGSASVIGDSEVREFSGMLELLRVFEDLIPAEHPAEPGAAER
jgi:hypothetical protein